MTLPTANTIQQSLPVCGFAYCILFIHESPCIVMLINAQDATSTWLSHSVATYISSNMKPTLYFSQFLELTVTYMFELCLEIMIHVLMKSLKLKRNGK